MNPPDEERLRSFLSMMDALPPPSAPTEPCGEAGGLAGILSSALSALAPSGGEDARAGLLRALRPFLSPARRDRVEGAITAMRLADVAFGAIYGDADDGRKDKPCAG